MGRTGGRTGCAREYAPVDDGGQRNRDAIGHVGAIRDMTHNIAKPDGIEAAERNEQAIIYWLARFGWLTSRQLARLVWPNASQSLRMAQRTLARLVARGEVLRRELPRAYGTAYVIGQRGARRLSGVDAENASIRGGRDLKFQAPYHRAICNDYAIDFLAYARTTNPELHQDVYTEMEIQRRQAPTPELFHEGRLHVPDLLLKEGDLYTWVEVEHTPKSKRRLDKLVAFAYHMLGSGNNKDKQTDLLVKDREIVGRVQQFVFLCPNKPTIVSCTKAILRRGRDKLAEDALTGLLVHHVKMSHHLIWGGVSASATADELLSANGQ